jgi:hypothetical protein
MRAAATLLVLAACAFGAAACGGGDEASDTGAATTTETTTTETEATTTDTDTTTGTDTTTDTDTDASPSFASGECRELVDAAADLSQSLGGTGTDTANLQDSQQVFQEFVDRAPDEIRADLQVLADAFAKYADALEGVDLKAGEAPDAATLQKLQAAVASIDQAEVQAASERVDTWARENCGVTGG